MDPKQFIYDLVISTFPVQTWSMLVLYSLCQIVPYFDIFNGTVYLHDWFFIRKFLTDILSDIHVHDPGFPLDNCASFMFCMTFVLLLYRGNQHVIAGNILKTLFKNMQDISNTQRRIECRLEEYKKIKDSQKKQPPAPQNEQTLELANKLTAPDIKRKKYSGEDFKIWFKNCDFGKIRKQFLWTENMLWDFFRIGLFVTSGLIYYLIMPNVLSASILEHARAGDNSQQLHFGLLWLLMILLQMKKCPWGGEQLRIALCMLLVNWSTNIALHDLERMYNDGDSDVEFYIALFCESMVFLMVFCRAYGIIPGDFVAEFLLQVIMIDHFVNPSQWKTVLKEHTFVGAPTVVCIVVFVAWRWNGCVWPYNNTWKTPLLLIPATRLQAVLLLAKQ
jgi:hypothetical protein